MSDWVHITGRWSIGAQLVLGIFSLFGFLRVNDSPPVLNIMLVLDTIVQFIELVFYILFVQMYVKKTYYRYVDWYITTPTMLFSTMVFLEYLHEPSLTMQQFSNSYPNEVVFIILMNFIMLSYGLLTELSLVPVKCGVFLGFIPFTSIFTVMYIQFGTKTSEGLLLLTCVCVVWALYGVAAFLSYVPKNVMYNVLDILSKNVYGVTITIYLLLH